jgi:hypothetical protein
MSKKIIDMFNKYESIQKLITFSGFSGITGENRFKFLRPNKKSNTFLTKERFSNFKSKFSELQKKYSYLNSSDMREIPTTEYSSLKDDVKFKLSVMMYLRESFDILLHFIDQLVDFLNDIYFPTYKENIIDKESVMEFVKSKQMFSISPHIFFIDVSVRLIKNFTNSLQLKYEPNGSTRTNNQYDTNERDREIIQEASEKSNNPINSISRDYNIKPTNYQKNQTFSLYRIKYLYTNEFRGKLNENVKIPSASEPILSIFRNLIYSLTNIFMQLKKIDRSFFHLFYESQYLDKKKKIQDLDKNITSQELGYHKNNKNKSFSAYLTEQLSKRNTNIYVFEYDYLNFGLALEQISFLQPELPSKEKENIILFLSKSIDSTMDPDYLFFYNEETFKILSEDIQKNILKNKMIQNSTVKTTTTTEAQPKPPSLFSRLTHFL